MNPPYYIFRRDKTCVGHPYANFCDSGLFGTGQTLADATKFVTVSKALTALASFARCRHIYGRPDFNNQFTLVKVTEFFDPPKTIRRILKDCEGCKDGEIVKFSFRCLDGSVRAVKLEDPEVSFYETTEAAFQAIRLYYPHSSIQIVRVAIRTVEGQKTVVETVLE